MARPDASIRISADLSSGTGKAVPIIDEKTPDQMNRRVVERGYVNFDRWAAGILTAQSSAYEEYLQVAIKYASDMLEHVENYSGYSGKHWENSDLGGAEDIVVNDAYFIKAYGSIDRVKRKLGKESFISAVETDCPVRRDKPLAKGKTDFLIRFKLERPKTFIRASKRLGIDEPALKDSWYVSIRQNTDRRAKVKLANEQVIGGEDKFAALAAEILGNDRSIFGDLKYTFNVELLSSSPVASFVANIASRGNEISVIPTTSRKISAATDKKRLLFWWIDPPPSLGLPPGGAAYMTNYVYHPGNDTSEFEGKLRGWISEFVETNEQEISGIMDSGQFSDAMGLKSVTPQALKRAGELKYKKAENFARNFKLPGRITLVDN